MSSSLPQFDEFRQALIGLEVSHVWRGYGSALFIEFGTLTPSKLKRRDGSQGNPRGECGLMVEWSWRIENRTSIVCGSWSDEDIWQAVFDCLRGGRVIDATLFGRLPEVSIELANGFFIVSFMTAEGDPVWALTDRRAPGSSRSIAACEGQLRVQVHPEKPVTPTSE
jgi:hypothetical protein